MNKKIELHEQTIRVQYDNGLTPKEIAERHYVSVPAIYEKLRELKIKIEHPFLRQGNYTKLKKMYLDKKYSIREISRKCNVSQQLVSKALKKFEIKRLNPSKGKGVKDE
jgi:predicted DNA-binding protein YlxM (UPF0122 family)